MLYDHGKEDVFEAIVGTGEVPEAWSRDSLAVEKDLGDDLVEREGVGLRGGAQVRNPEHLEHRGEVRVATDALDAVGQVEHQARPFPRHHPGHELPELLDHVHVALEHPHVVTAILQRGHDGLKGLWIAKLGILPAKNVDHTASIAVVHDRNFHGSSTRSGW